MSDWDLLVRAVGRRLRGERTIRFRDAQFAADDLAVRKRNLSFLEEPRFAEAWRLAKEANRAGWSVGVPDIRWRAHIACWAARHALNLEGDFVECGVHTGLLSMTIAHYLDFAKLDRTFYLFDTFAGIPIETLGEGEREMAEEHNALLYFDCYEIAKANFAPYPNIKLVRGTVPETLEQTPIEKVAYLSIDMNNSVAERAALEHFWPKLSSGAVIVFDDYAGEGYSAQADTINEFCRDHGVAPVNLPTMQGLLIKP
ncbi:MAG: TylF/MycF/NovP-related O-methyltransferase [Caulobacteraceae bacterium]|nr:TylF/MycF/NovP-related O-methyltransferase [Caulobacteraceae bacterium]